MRKKRYLIGGLLLALIAVVGITYLTEAAPVEGTDVDRRAIAVSVSPVTTGNLDETLYTLGEIAPAATYQVAAVSPGEITRVNVAVGDRVAAGDVLFEMKRSAYEVNRSTTLQQLNEAVAQAKRQLDLAEATLEDQRRLHEEGATSRAALDQAENNRDNAASAYQNALANRRQTENNLSEQLDQYVYESPIDGIVVAGSLAPGQKVGAGQGYTVIAGDALEVKTSVSSRYMDRVAAGQKAYLSFIDREEPVAATVDRIGLLPQGGVYPVTLSIEGADGLLPGMVADITLMIGGVSDALIVPDRALLSNGEGTYAYVVEGDTARRRQVETGLSEGGLTVVTSGLEAGESLVVSGQSFLDDGAPVVIE
jgi:RND family efflux transporter MFP subunit